MAKCKKKGVVLYEREWSSNQYSSPPFSVEKSKKVSFSRPGPLCGHILMGAENGLNRSPELNHFRQSKLSHLQLEGQGSRFGVLYRAVVRSPHCHIVYSPAMVGTAALCWIIENIPYSHVSAVRPRRRKIISYSGIYVTFVIFKGQVSNISAQTTPKRWAFYVGRPKKYPSMKK